MSLQPDERSTVDAMFPQDAFSTLTDLHRLGLAAERCSSVACTGPGPPSC
jgi:hypothetical protein